MRNKAFYLLECFLSCLFAYLLNICSKIWLWNEQRIYWRFKKLPFVVIYSLPPLGFLQTKQLISLVVVWFANSKRRQLPPLPVTGYAHGMDWGKHKEVKLVHEVKLEVYSRDEARHRLKSAISDCHRRGDGWTSKCDNIRGTSLKRDETPLLLHSCCTSVREGCHHVTDVNDAGTQIRLPRQFQFSLNVIRPLTYQNRHIKTVKKLKWSCPIWVTSVGQGLGADPGFWQSAHR